MNNFKKKLADYIPYAGYMVFILALCISFFSTNNTDGKSYVYGADGKKIEVNDLSAIKSSKDSTKKSKGSLDGTQQINAPKSGSSDKPFNPNEPFNKITFRQLRTYVPGQVIPQDVKDLDGKNVAILGFMTPLNSLDNIEEFLLCSAPPLSCYCAPPIFINEIIYVKLQNIKSDFKTGAILVKGQLHVNMNIKDEYSDVIYTLDGVSME
ncbi:hypothetical protein BH10BAC5_BH10BAC5_15530 [soil metagenome]